MKASPGWHLPALLWLFRGVVSCCNYSYHPKQQNIGTVPAVGVLHLFPNLSPFLFQGLSQPLGVCSPLYPVDMICNGNALYT